LFSSLKISRLAFSFSLDVIIEQADRMYCEESGREICHDFESVHISESNSLPGRLLSIECYNREMATYAGIYFQHHQFPPIELADIEGKKHLFYVATSITTVPSGPGCLM